jgi:hypothetical protein
MVKAAIVPSSGRLPIRAVHRPPSLLDLWLTAFGKHQRNAVKRLDTVPEEKSTCQGRTSRSREAQESKDQGNCSRARPKSCCMAASPCFRQKEIEPVGIIGHASRLMIDMAGCASCEPSICQEERPSHKMRDLTLPDSQPKLRSSSGCMIVPSSVRSLSLEVRSSVSYPIRFRTQSFKKGNAHENSRNLAGRGANPSPSRDRSWRRRDYDDWFHLGRLDYGRKR